MSNEQKEIVVQTSSLVASSDVKEFRLTIPQNIIEHRDTMLEFSNGITSISNAAELQAAVDQLAEVRRFNKDVEDSRESTKAPFWDACKKIDATAKALAKPTLDEETRLKNLIAEFQREEQRKIQRAQAEEAARQRAEQERLENLRRQEEAARAAAEAAKGKAKKKLEEEAKAAEDARIQAEMDQQFAEPAVVEAPAAAEGMKTKVEYDYEVVDLHALYAHNRRYVKLEPIRSEIRLTLNNEHRKGPPAPIPGLKIIEKINVQVKASSTPTLSIQ